MNWLMNHTYKEILKYVVKKIFSILESLQKLMQSWKFFYLKNHKIRLFLVIMVRVKESEMKIFIIFIFIGLICRVNIWMYSELWFFPHFQLDVLYFKWRVNRNNKWQNLKLRRIKVTIINISFETYENVLWWYYLRSLC